MILLSMLTRISYSKYTLELATIEDINHMKQVHYQFDADLKVPYVDPVHATGKLLLAVDESQLLLQWKANSQAYELDAKYSRSTPGEHLIYAKIQADDKVHLLSIKAQNGQDKMLEIDFQADKHYFFLGKVSSSVLVR